MNVTDLKKFDTVRLKDGTEGDIMEIFPNGALVIDIGDSPATWDTLYDKTVDDVETIVEKHGRT